MEQGTTRMRWKELTRLQVDHYERVTELCDLFWFCKLGFQSWKAQTLKVGCTLDERKKNSSEWWEQLGSSVRISAGGKCGEVGEKPVFCSVRIFVASQCICKWFNIIYHPSERQTHLKCPTDFSGCKIAIILRSSCTFSGTEFWMKLESLDENGLNVRAYLG